MKKIFTLVATALVALSANAQVELSWATMQKNETGDNAADQNAIKFLDSTGAETGFILQPTGGRTQAGPMERESCSGMALNFKNNTSQTLIIPEGQKIYKINFYGWSSGDNWCYLYAFGPVIGSDAEPWYWTDPIGTGVNGDNTKIIDQAVYPLDPCVVVEDNVKDSEKTCFHNAGYCFASIDLTSDDPDYDGMSGQFCFQFSGANQERAWMVVYTDKASAAAAPAAEAPRLGKANSQTIFIDAAAASLNDVAAKASADTEIYNLLGQKVGKGYRGFVIVNGRKALLK